MDVDVDNCVLTKVYEPEPLLRPCLVNFEYGTITKEDLQEVETKMVVGKEKNERTLILSRKGHSYSGKLGIKKNLPWQTLLLIRNKKKNTAKLVPFESCTLEPQIEPVINRPRKSTINVDKETTYNESINALSKAFGSKKSKKITEMRQRMSLQGHIGNSIAEDIADVTVTECDVSTNFEVAEAAVMATLPPCDRSAKDVANVYELSKLVSDAELNSLNTVAQFYLDNPPTDDDQKTAFFIHSMFSALDSNPPLLSVKIILFANALVTFVNMSANDIKQKSALKTICPSSHAVGSRILNDFTINAEHTKMRPINLRDKAVCYVMVLILLINKYKLDLNSLTSSIKNYGLKKLAQLAKMVGLSPTSAKGSQTFVLKLPLPQLPVVINRARNRKK